MNSISIPQPFSAHGLLYVTSGYVGDAVKPVFAIRPGASGDITLQEDQESSEYIAWYDETAGPYNPTPLVYGDYYFTLLDRGFFTCTMPGPARSGTSPSSRSSVRKCGVGSIAARVLQRVAVGV